MRFVLLMNTTDGLRKDSEMNVWTLEAIRYEEKFATRNSNKEDRSAVCGTQQQQQLRNFRNDMIYMK